MKAIIGKKVGMTTLYDEQGKQLACTVIQAGPCVVTQVKTKDTDGYNALQVAFDDKKDKNTSAGEKGHFAKANTTPKRKVVEFRDLDLNKSIGETITAELFIKGDKVEATGTSKGKGFQGVVRRHGFSGVGMATHGQHNRLRAPGSIGACSTPSRVFKGIRMGGQMGVDTVKVKNLKVHEVMADKNLIILTGAVPGSIGSYVVIESK
jgi:large subunit ribosomal protein L3